MPSPALLPTDKEEGDSGIDANSQGSCSSSDVKAQDKLKSKKKKKSSSPIISVTVHPNLTDKKIIDKSEPPSKSGQKTDSKLVSKSENKSSSNLSTNNDNKINTKQEKENVAPLLYNSIGDVATNKLGKEKQKSIAESSMTMALGENKNDKRDK